MSSKPLTKEEIIAAWKDPEIRAKFNDVLFHPAGKTYGELTEEELAQIQGASGIKPATTPNCLIIPLTGSIIIC